MYRESLTNCNASRCETARLEGFMMLKTRVAGNFLSVLLLYYAVFRWVGMQFKSQ